jgi:hypothetical protein
VIKLKHLDIYKRYGGIKDGWVIHHKYSKGMTDEIWNRIEGFIDGITIIKNGLASDEFMEKTKQSLNAECENEQVVSAIINMSKFPRPEYSFTYIYEGQSQRAFANEYQLDGKSRYRIITKDIYCEITSDGAADSNNKTIWIQSDKLGEPIQPDELVQVLGHGIEYAKLS